MSNFQQLNLNPIIVTTLENKGYTAPTPIQEQSIPHLLQKKDLLGIAQTGTGKTAAFSLPMIDLLSSNKRQVGSNQIRSLILTPTRELAVQIGENIAAYSKGLGIKHTVIFGGVNEFHQINALKGGQDIVVATPGRLLDLASQGHLRFSQIEIFVLDEADRMLDMGFINDVRKIISKLPQERQSLLFSATMPDTIARLANSILRNPVKIEITPQSTTVERINQKVYLVEKSNKSALLLDVLTKPEVVAALVFSKTKHGANKVVSYLQKYGVQVAVIHGNKSQPAREKALNDFRAGKIKVLVATDIAARGIDVSSISHVINYDIPVDPESYVHRIGRTARAGRDGIAISFCDSGETLQLRAVEKAIRMKIPVDNSHPFHGKAPTHDPNEGRLLSRKPMNKTSDKTGMLDRNSNQRNSRDDSNKNEGFDRRKSRHDSNKIEASDRGGFDRKRSRDDRDKWSTKSTDSRSSKRGFFSKNKRSNDENSSGDSKSIAKKILTKLGFRGFGKKAEFKDSNQRTGEFSKSRTKSGGGKFFTGNKGKPKSSKAGSSFKSYRKPFGKK